MASSASATLPIDSNMKENTDNKELIKINANMKSIENDDNNNQDKATFAEKVKSKPRPKSWAEQATPPPLAKCDSEFINACFGDDNQEDNTQDIESSKDNQKGDNQEEYQEEYQEDDDYQITPFQLELLDRIEYLENTQDILIEDNDKQKSINSSLREQLDLNYYLSINIFIHAIGSNQENHFQSINKKIPLRPENFQIVTFCDINEKNGNVKFDDGKLIEFLKKREPKNNINEKHITYWINKAIKDNYIQVTLNITSVEIANDNSHIKSKLKSMFDEFKEHFEYQQALQKKIKEEQTNSKEHKPKIYINSKNIKLDNSDVNDNQIKSKFDSNNQNSDSSPKMVNDNQICRYVDNHNNNYSKYKNKKHYDSNRQQFKQLSDEDKQEIMNMRANRDCWKFLNTGICQFGDQCHYKHDENKRLKMLNRKKVNYSF